mmetsp:Transcript_2226/g.2858  ORF Transcript_2226/g.2858 Transcript_2226/m.2858 type:complete len:254 (+) Transcript_2226:783-1544(+)
MTKIKMFQEERIDRAGRLAAGCVSAAVREEQRAQLRVLREAREKVAAMAMERRVRQEIEEIEEKKLDAERKRRQRDEARLAMDEYREVLRKRKEIEKVEETQREYLEEVGRLERMSKNDERVSYRRDKHKKKLHIQHENAQHSIQLEKRRLERLSALAASVPYHSTIQTLKPNPRKPTASSLQAFYYEDTRDLTEFQKGDLRGFTNERVFKDLRFRLGHALHAAGVAKSDYARSIVKRLIPRNTERTTGIMPH